MATLDNLPRDEKPVAAMDLDLLGHRNLWSRFSMKLAANDRVLRRDGDERRDLRSRHLVTHAIPFVKSATVYEDVKAILWLLLLAGLSLLLLHAGHPLLLADEPSTC
jgi:hypothetical protein